MRKRPRPDQIAAILRQIQADLQAGLNLHQASPTSEVRLAGLVEPSDDFHAAGL
ncbi:MAG: hypothetical protein JO116_15750 [Planctomycetaceae bacterium]|nr:hypothetical protein [Planctomycetaceae bacterium]